MDGGSWHCTGGRDQNNPQEKEMQKSKMAVWRGLTNSYEKKRSQSKGEKERYSHLNSEFQRIARSDKKAFLSDQCQEIEENNRLWNTRDLFKKVRDTKGKFHAKLGTIKDRNGMELIEAEDIRRGGKNTQKNHTKRSSWPRKPRLYDHSPTASHPGMWS